MKQPQNTKERRPAQNKAPQKVRVTYDGPSEFLDLNGTLHAQGSTFEASQADYDRLEASKRVQVSKVKG